MAMAKYDGNDLPGQRITQHDDVVTFRFLRVSSDEIVSGTSTAFQVNFGNDTRLTKTMEIHLISASIPNVNPNVTAARGNNVFTMTFGVGGTQSVTIPDGQYTTSQLLTLLSAGFTAIIAGGPITFTQDPNTNLITFTITGGNTAQITAGQAVKPSLDFTLGFTQSTGGLAASATAANFPNLAGDTMFYIHSSILSNNATYLNSDNGNIIDVNGFVAIPVTVPFGDNQPFQGNELDGRIVLGSVGRSTNQFDITLRTNGGMIVPPFGPNFEMVLNFKLYYRPPNLYG